MIKSGFIDRWFHVEVILQLSKTLFWVFYYLNLGLNEYFTAVENEGITIIINIKVNTWKMSAKSSQESNLKKKKQESRMNEKWSLQMYRWTQANFFPVSTVTWAWTTSLSFQHTYSKPSPISKNCEYMPPLPPCKWCIYSVQCWHEGWSLWYAPGYFSLHCKVHRACPSS